MKFTFLKLRFYQYLMIFLLVYKILPQLVKLAKIFTKHPMFLMIEILLCLNI